MEKNKWLKDLERGEEVEKKILSKLQIKYPKAYKMEGNFKYYDIMIPEVNKTIEIKNDMGSADTSNYFIEMSCNYESSGIVATKANYWIIYDEVDVIWIKTSRLKAICDIQGKYYSGVPKGSTSRIEAKLVPQELLRAGAEIIQKGSVYEL